MRVITKAHLYTDSGRIELIPVSLETMEEIKNRLGDAIGIPVYICLKEEDDRSLFYLYPNEDGMHAIEATVENYPVNLDLTNPIRNNTIVNDE